MLYQMLVCCRPFLGSCIIEVQVISYCCLYVALIVLKFFVLQVVISC